MATRQGEASTSQAAEASESGDLSLDSDIAVDVGLTDAQLMEVFKQTSIFNVKSALANNENLVHAEAEEEQQYDFLSDSDLSDTDEWDYLRGFWSGNKPTGSHALYNASKWTTTSCCVSSNMLYRDLTYLPKLSQHATEGKHLMFVIASFNQQLYKPLSAANTQDTCVTAVAKASNSTHLRSSACHCDAGEAGADIERWRNLEIQEIDVLNNRQKTQHRLLCCSDGVSEWIMHCQCPASLIDTAMQMRTRHTTMSTGRS